MSKFVQFVDSEIEFALQFFAPDTKSVARMPQKFCFSGLLLANQATQFIARAALGSPCTPNSITRDAGIDRELMLRACPGN